MIRENACAGCHGTGKCSRCNGSGHRTQGMPSPTVISEQIRGGSAAAARRTCPDCLGSGTCQVCLGTGENPPA
jgi:hypothetical protein